MFKGAAQTIQLGYKLSFKKFNQVKSRPISFQLQVKSQQVDSLGKKSSGKEFSKVKSHPMES